MTDVASRLFDLSTRMNRFESRDLLVEASELIRKLERRQVPESWSSPDGTEWSAISGDGVLDVRGSKTDIDVVISWHLAKDRLAWFEEEYKKSQAREAQYKATLEKIESEVEGLRTRYGRGR